MGITWLEVKLSRGHIHESLLHSKRFGKSTFLIKLLLVQECNRYHGAAEGDGWFEQSSRPTFFGLFKQDDPTQAYCVEGGHVYLCTSWVECQVSPITPRALDCMQSSSCGIEARSPSILGKDMHAFCPDPPSLKILYAISRAGCVYSIFLSSL
jgi:hypothetical protein